MSGELPRLSLRISDVKFRNVLELVESIPLPETKPAAHGTASSSTPKVRTGGWCLDGPFHIVCGSDKLPRGNKTNYRKIFFFLLQFTAV